MVPTQHIASPFPPQMLPAPLSSSSTLFRSRFQHLQIFVLLLVFHSSVYALYWTFLKLISRTLFENSKTQSMVENGRNLELNNFVHISKHLCTYWKIRPDNVACFSFLYYLFLCVTAVKHVQFTNSKIFNLTVLEK